MDFMQAGLSLSQVVVIDYTKSNGNLREPSSLHHIDKETDNQYEACIKLAGSILFPYNKTKDISVYGMGASMSVIGVNETTDFFYLQTEDLPYAT